MLGLSLSAELVRSIVERYYLCLGGKRVWCPYWRDKSFWRGGWRRVILGAYGGKGTPEEIEKAVIKVAGERGVDLTEMTGGEIRELMAKDHIGVDCSGFVYYVLDRVGLALGRGSLDGIVKSRVTKNPFNSPRFRTDADCLTNDRNTVGVDFPRERMRPGDLIRMMGGKHVAIVISAGRKEVVYAHSSELTKVSGVHWGKIRLGDLQRGLEYQEWQEVIRKERSLREYFDPAVGDGVRRLKAWADG